MRLALYVCLKNICDGVGCQNESIDTPLYPPLFWLDNIFKRTKTFQKAAPKAQRFMSKGQKYKGFRKRVFGKPAKKRKILERCTFQKCSVLLLFLNFFLILVNLLMIS
jgi:hypothetical protein